MDSSQKTIRMRKLKFIKKTLSLIDSFESTNLPYEIIELIIDYKKQMEKHSAVILLRKQLCCKINTIVNESDEFYNRMKPGITVTRHFFDYVMYFGEDNRMNRLLIKHGTGRWMTTWTGAGRIMGYTRPKIRITGWI